MIRIRALIGAATMGGKINQVKEKATMATEKEMYELLGKALAESEFRAALSADPAGAAASIGTTLTEDQEAAFKASDLSKAAEGLDERLSKVFTCGLGRLSAR